jgi:hypothetical protein
MEPTPQIDNELHKERHIHAPVIHIALLSERRKIVLGFYKHLVPTGTRSSTHYFLFPIVLACATMPGRGKALASHPEFFPTTGDS